MTEKLKLGEDDFKILFASEKIKLGTKTLEIKPLSMEQTFKVLDSLQKFVAEQNPDGKTDLLSSTTIYEWVKKVPYILSDIVNMEEEDLVKLPMGTIIEIFEKLIDVDNSLVKNFLSLLQKVRQIWGGSEEEEKVKTKKTKKKKSSA